MRKSHESEADHITRIILAILTAILFTMAVYTVISQVILPKKYRRKAMEQTEYLIENSEIGTLDYLKKGTIGSEYIFAKEVYALAVWERGKREVIKETLEQNSVPDRYQRAFPLFPSEEYYLVSTRKGTLTAQVQGYRFTP